MSDEGNSRSRAILNANRGISNVIDYSVIKKDLQGVADKLFNILKGHYGPFSGFAAIDSGNALEETQFTKDGIGIVRAIEFVSPQEDWVRKTIGYIGTKIENSVGDGTTSAMMFTCAMLKHMIEHVDEIRPISYNELRDKYNYFVSQKVTKWMDHAKYSLDKHKKDDQKVIHDIVWNQVYTSSHGDTELAKAIADIFVATPKELWDRMIYERKTWESDERFVVHKSEGQYQMNCSVMMTGMLNKDLSTWYEAKNCKVFVMNDTIRSSNEDGWTRIVDAMRNATPEQPFVLLSHKRMDANSYQEFMNILNECVRANKPVAIFQNDPDNPRINDFVTLMLLKDIEIVKVAKNNWQDIVEIDGVDVTWKDKLLTLDKLYEVPEEYKDSLQRHQMIDGKHMQYTDYAESVKELADGYAKLDLTRDTREKMNSLYRMYGKLAYAHSAVLQIGGSTLDNLALIDVVDDCMRAASRALKHGVVYGNNRSLYLALIKNRNNNSISRTEQWFIDRMKESLDDIAYIVLERLNPKLGKFRKWTLKKKWCKWWYTHVVDLLGLGNSIRFNTMLNCVLPVSVTGEIKDLDPHTPHIVQPANADISMLERFGEVALKYVLTERIIIHGTAYVDPKTRSKK